MMFLLFGCFGPGTDDLAVSRSPVPTDDTGPIDDSAPADDTAITAAPVDASALLAALRDDRDTTLLDVSRETGWPAPVEGGWLFVCTLGSGYELAGDHGGWVPEGMTQEDGFSWLVRPAEVGGGYKYTDGDDWAADPWARAYRYDEFGELSLLPNPATGHLERQYRVDGQGLEARTLHVWVPAGGHTHTLYMMDGQNLFDPDASYGGWQVDHVVPEGTLVVGIDNVAARAEEYTHVEDFIYGAWYGGDAATYGAYLQEDVRGLITSVYGAEGTVGLLGSSLGGLVSFVIADAYPGEYAFAGSMSGTMGWGSIGADNPTIIEIYAAAGHRDTALYLDSGGGGDCVDADGDGIDDDDPTSSDNYCENLQLRDVLAAGGYTFDVDLWHWWEPGAQHDEAAWAARVDRPLAIFADL